MTAVRVVVALVAAYFIGGLPSALIIGKVFYKVDIRTVGSGNVGATNALRGLGVRAGTATYLMDFGKGLVAVLLAWLLVPPALGEAVHQWTLVGAAFAVIAGHSFSPYIRFSGGKGVAVSSGALLVITPLVWPFLLGTFVIVVVLSRRVSLGSIVVAALYPITVAVLYPGQTPLTVFSIVAAALVLWRHRSNIVRIARGTEPRVSLRRNRSDAPDSQSADSNGTSVSTGHQVSEDERS